LKSGNDADDAPDGVISTPICVRQREHFMPSHLPLRRSSRSTLLRGLGLAAVLTAALLALMSSGVRPGTGPMERSSFHGGAGYWLLAKDGGVFAFGDAQFFGPNRNQGNDIAGMAATATGNGYWTVDDDGDVFNYGDAVDYGSRPGPEIDNISGFAGRTQGDGYWMVARDGSVYAFGGAKYFGSANRVPLVRPIVGMAATPSGQGYWLIAGDGGVFAYGDAPFFGSTGGIRLTRPIVDFGPSPDGKGYRFIGSDGGVFAYGTAGFFGSTGAMRLNKEVVGFSTTASGNGYWLVGEDGGVFAFGDAKFYGSTGAITLNSPIVAIVATPRVKVSPIARDDAATVAEDGSSVTVDVEGNDTHLLPASVSVATQPAHGTASVSGGKVVYSPAANYNGQDTFTYKLTDTVGHSATATVTITVTPVNDAPVAAVGSARTNEDTVLNGSVSATDVDGGPLTYAKVGSPSHGTVTVNANGTFAYTPTANYHGSDSFTFKANDGAADSNTATFTITVVSVNDGAPVATAGSGSTAEDTALDGSVSATDVDSDTLAYTRVAAPTHGTVTVNANGTFTYTPTANFNGSDSFTFKANDGTVDSNTATFSITVTAVNDAPTISAIGDLSVDGDTTVGPLAFTYSDPDAGATLTVTGSSDNQTLVPDAGVDVEAAEGVGTVTVTPATDESGQAVITLTVGDGAGGIDTETFTLTVAVRHQPVAEDDDENYLGIGLGIDVLANDTGLSDGPVTVTIVDGSLLGTEGIASVTVLNSILFVALDSDGDGLVSLQYKVTDADGDFAVGTVTVHVV
jgi:VCBS repeat-containing protein